MEKVGDARIFTASPRGSQEIGAVAGDIRNLGESEHQHPSLMPSKLHVGNAALGGAERDNGSMKLFLEI